MKKVSLLAIVAAITFVFSSCSTEENLLSENQNLSKKYTLKRDATGAYSVDVDTDDNTNVDKVVDFDSNVSEFIFSESDTPTQKELSHNLLIENEQLKVSFVDGNTNERSSFTVFDDDISLHRKANVTKLASYSIKGNEEGTYTLDFQVNANVDVSFVYNESISTYEIHLEDGVGEESNFSRTLEKQTDIPLKIDFVNYVINQSAKSEELALIRRPEVIIN